MLHICVQYMCVYMRTCVCVRVRVYVRVSVRVRACIREYVWLKNDVILNFIIHRYGQF